MSTEEWRDIPGYEGAYQISSTGRTRSMDRVVHFRDGRVRRYPGVVLKAQIHSETGYHNISLPVDPAEHNGKTQLPFGIHRLLCLAWHGDPFDGAHAAHRNGTPGDNRPANVYWATPTENRLDAISHGWTKPKQSQCIHGHEYTEENSYIAPNGGRHCRTCHRNRVRHRRAA